MRDTRESAANPAGWPAEVSPVLKRFITCEYATLTRAGTPITLPLTPYLGEDGRTLDVSTGVTYPAKAERVRRNPRVCMLFSNPAGSRLKAPPVVLVYGLAAVDDHDLQANTDRYIRLSRRKLPGLYYQLPWFILRRQTWYWTRIWIHTTPVRILWWPGDRVDEPPQRWDAPYVVKAPRSDPPPPGAQPPPWQPPHADWRDRAAYALRQLGAPVLTVVDRDGFPVPFRARRAAPTEDGFELELPPGRPSPVAGPACLTFHTHDRWFFSEENATFVGNVTASGFGTANFSVDRALGDLSIPGSWPRRVWTVYATRSRLDPRLQAEVERREQPVPEIRRT
jgi:hypothetical protein